MEAKKGRKKMIKIGKNSINRKKERDRVCVRQGETDRQTERQRQ